MVNILIKVVVILMVFVNLYSPIVKADSGNLKQCFYIIKEYQNSKDLNEDLDSLNNMKIPVFAVIDPNENISKNVIDVLERLQRETKLDILLENKERLEKSYFAVKGYSDKLQLSGLCHIQGDKLSYIGENNIVFDLVEITADPLITISQISMEKKHNTNYALVIDGYRFNVSTLLLAYNELQGLPLQVTNYSFNLNKPALIYNIFTHVGDVSIALFSISIVIFAMAIVIFKKWSREKFLD